MKALVLESERLRFEPLSLRHLSEHYVNWMNDIDVYRYLETGGNYTLQDLKDYLSDYEEKDVYFWAILIKSTEQHIGNIKIDPLNLENNSGEYGIMMGDKTEWGKGYAKEATLRILDFCFENISLSQVTLGVVENNTNALQLYKKLGFEEENIKERKSSTYDGVVCETIRMVKHNDK
jgi:RimJ/RimL family protein N-acetyltransferase